MNTCKTCKWWHSLEAVPPMGNCDSPKIVLTWPVGDEIMNNSNDDKIVTGPDFGCIHWQALQPCNPQTHPPQEPA